MERYYIEHDILKNIYFPEDSSLFGDNEDVFLEIHFEKKHKKKQAEEYASSHEEPVILSEEELLEFYYDYMSNSDIDF